jgi:hypothetical protein
MSENIIHYRFPGKDLVSVYSHVVKFSNELFVGLGSKVEFPLLLIPASPITMKYIKLSFPELQVRRR